MKQEEYLSILTQISGDRLKPFVDQLLPDIGRVTVLSNRTGLVMLPYTDSVQGTPFHLGEVLVAEAHVSLADHEGYGAVLGRDLELALAVAILDAALQAGRQTATILNFIATESVRLRSDEELLLRQVEATRVEMETF